MVFDKKLSINIQHDYFDKGQAPGISISPTPQCGRLLKKFKLLTKYGIEFIIFSAGEENDASSQIKPAASQFFDFLISATDNQFSTYTRLIPKKDDEIYLFINQKDKPDLKLTVVSKSQFNLQNSPQVFGVMRLTFNSPSPVSVTLKFEAPIVKWKFYVLTNTNLPHPVIDSSLPGVAFIKQNSDSQTNDSIAGALAAGFPAAIISVFESDKEIVLSRTGKKNIRLRNSFNNVIVMNHLPNPNAQENGIKIINLFN
ncbi:hypothetical protein SNE26_08150 [Mucilaginibacter sp. cycad4]|uniref:hypothetical protein n=1 Tax=Mucilaginibacter sp. cycad4 TaxID=3342096 RepID=UPI002AABAFE7|nr:hypothetical protein [Mucilaginibacter gossypii]WPV01741.1 hypothetical protein SNE26_08150 [Mucilaginibacter gossypii]